MLKNLYIAVLLNQLILSLVYIDEKQLFHRHLNVNIGLVWVELAQILN